MDLRQVNIFDLIAEIQRRGYPTVVFGEADFASVEQMYELRGQLEDVLSERGNQFISDMGAAPDDDDDDACAALLLDAGPVTITHDDGGERETLVGAFATIRAAESYLGQSATIDSDDLAAGRYSINAPHGAGSDDEALQIANRLGFMLFWSMGGAYYAPPGVAVTGNTSGKGWKGGFDSLEHAAHAANATVEP
jgi:hypothetical protein